MSRNTVLATFLCLLTGIPLAGPSAATITKVQYMDELQNNVFLRAATVASERSVARNGQMTDISDGVLPAFPTLSLNDVGTQLNELNEFLRKRDPAQAHFKPTVIVDALKTGETVYFALNEADLKAIFGASSPFEDEDFVFVVMKKKPDAPVVEVIRSTLVNKKAYP